MMTADGTEGVWTYAMELARALDPWGVEILLAVMGPALSEEQREEAARLEHLVLCQEPFALEWMKDPWRDVTEAGDWLLELEELFAPGVVHLNHYCHGSLPWSSPVMITAHGCVLSWWQAVHGEESPRSWTRYHAEVSAGLRGANIVSASTQAVLDGLIRLYAPLPRLMHFQHTARFPEFRKIPRGCDARRFRPLLKRDYVLSVGFAEDEAQNLEALHTAAKGLPWPVVLVGREPMREERNNAWPHLVCLDSLTTAGLASKMGHAEIFAQPSRYDPFGFTALGAGLAGCALVLGDIPTLRETWGEAALFVPPDDPEALHAVLHALTDDAPLRREMADRARQTALAQTPDRMARSTLDSYHALAVPQMLA